MLACTLAWAVPKLEKSPTVPVKRPNAPGLFKLYVVPGAARLGRFHGRLCPSRRRLSFARSFTVQLLVTKNCIQQSPGACSVRAPREPMLYESAYANALMSK